MVCTVFSISASADGFSVNRHNFTLFALCRQPVVQAARKLRRVQLFKNAAECITVRYTVRKFEKISQKILSFLTKLFYISEVLPSAYYGTHSNDDILKLMADVSVSRSPRISDIFHLFFQCFYVHIFILPLSPLKVNAVALQSYPGLTHEKQVKQKRGKRHHRNSGGVFWQD